MLISHWAYGWWRHGMQKLKPFLQKPDRKEESSNGEKTNGDLKWPSKAVLTGSAKQLSVISDSTVWTAGWSWAGLLQVQLRVEQLLVRSSWQVADGDVNIINCAVTLEPGVQGHQRIDRLKHTWGGKSKLLNWVHIWSWTSRIICQHTNTNTNRLLSGKHHICPVTSQLSVIGSVSHHRLMLAWTCSVEQAEVEGQRVAERALTSSDLPIHHPHPQCHHVPLSHREEELGTHVKHNIVGKTVKMSHLSQWNITF